MKLLLSLFAAALASGIVKVSGKETALCTTRPCENYPTDRIIFMSMFNDIDWTKKGNDGICISNAEKVKDYSMSFFLSAEINRRSLTLSQQSKIVPARTTAACSARDTTQALHPGSPLPHRGKEEWAHPHHMKFQ